MDKMSGQKRSNDECQQLAWNGSCCCTCVNRINDYSHPCTDGKRTVFIRGYICQTDDLGSHSGWTKHGICELWKKRPVRPDPESDKDHDKVEAYWWDVKYREEK
jgi:hypothetical protein